MNTAIRQPFTPAQVELDCAIIANADYIVSEDSHFKELNTIPFPQVRLLSLPQFMEDMGYHLNNVEP